MDDDIAVVRELVRDVTDEDDYPASPAQAMPGMTVLEAKDAREVRRNAQKQETVEVCHPALNSRPH